MSASLMPGLGDASLMPFADIPTSTFLKAGSAGTATFVLPAAPDGYYANVTFTLPFISANYSVALGVEANNRTTFVPTVTNVTAAGFRILLNTRNKNNLVAITWTATLW